MNARTTASARVCINTGFYRAIADSNTCRPLGLYCDARAWLQYRLCLTSPEATRILNSWMGARFAYHWLRQPTEADQNESFAECYRLMGSVMPMAAECLRMYDRLPPSTGQQFEMMKRAFRC